MNDNDLNLALKEYHRLKSTKSPSFFIAWLKTCASIVLIVGLTLFVIWVISVLPGWMALALVFILLSLVLTAMRVD